MIHRRRFHFKSPPLQDPALQRFGEWTEENKACYANFRRWLKENGYGDSALGIYGAAMRMAVGYLRKQYWTIDLETDFQRVREHLAESKRTANTQTDYLKGLKKFEEYLRLRCHRPQNEREIPWEYTTGSLSPALQEDLHEFLQHCQRTWKLEQRFERSRDLLYEVARPLRWMAEHEGLKNIQGLTPQVWFAWMDYRLAEGIKPVTVNCDLSALRHFVYFLRGSGHEVCERFLLVQPLKAGYRLPRDVPVEQLRKLQAVIQAQANARQPGRQRIGRMDLAWFLLMLHCGLRTCEIRQLKLQDIEWEAKRLRIEQSKALKDRQIYLDEAVLGQ
jgi:hypothetical protein